MSFNFIFNEPVALALVAGVTATVLGVSAFGVAYAAIRFRRWLRVDSDHGKLSLETDCEAAAGE